MTESGGQYLFPVTRHPPGTGVYRWLGSLLAGFTGAHCFRRPCVSKRYAFPHPSRVVAEPSGARRHRGGGPRGVLHGVPGPDGGRVSELHRVVFKVTMIVGFPRSLPASLRSRQEGAAPTPPPAMPFSLAAFAGSLVWISLSYSGFNAAAYVPAKRNMPGARAAIPSGSGTAVVTVLYLALNAAFVDLPPFEAVVGREDAAAAAAQAIGGQPAALAIRFIIVLALTSSVFSLVMAGPRVYARMADDGVFPGLFRLGPEGAPTAAMLGQAGLAIVLILLSDLRGLLSDLGFTLSISAALSVASLFLIVKPRAASLCQSGDTRSRPCFMSS